MKSGTPAGGLAGPAGLTGRIRPMLAVPAELPPDDGTWAYEMKWDGVRALAFLGGLLPAGTDGRRTDRGGTDRFSATDRLSAGSGRGTAAGVRLQSRSGRDITATYPELASLAAALPGAAVVLDGEIVALGAGTSPSFETLQQRMHLTDAADVRRIAAAVPVTYLAFDVLYAGGRPLLDAPYAQRRAVLAGLARDGLGQDGSRCQVPPYFTGETGADMLRVSVLQDLEGVLAKRLDSRYVQGRSASWRKVKNIQRQEMVVGGWKPGAGGRAGRIGSLLIGVYGPGGLTYAGHVGTGFSAAALALLGQRLEPLRRAGAPFADEVPPEHARGAVWTAPALVIEVAFAGWTNAGRLRHPSYQGLRDDKDPADVVRET